MQKGQRKGRYLPDISPMSQRRYSAETLILPRAWIRRKTARNDIMPTARIKLTSRNRTAAKDIARQIVEIAKAAGIKYKGPIPLPTRKLRISTRKTPCGDGSHTYEAWQMRIHKWLVSIEGSDQALRQIMRIPVPDTVQIEMILS